MPFRWCYLVLLQLRFFLWIVKSLGQVVLIGDRTYICLCLLVFEWVLIAVPRESALCYDCLVSQILILKLECLEMDLWYFCPLRDTEITDIGNVLPDKQMGASWPLFSAFPIVTSFWISFHVLWRKAGLADLSHCWYSIRTTSSHYSDYRPNTQKIKEKRTVWLHLPEGNLCWIPLWGGHRLDNETCTEIMRKSNPNLSPDSSPNGTGSCFILVSWLWWTYEIETFVFKGEWWI